MTHLELETAARYLEREFSWPIDRIRTELTRRMDEERPRTNWVLMPMRFCRKGALALEKQLQ
jgi:hypothetical protein